MSIATTAIDNARPSESVWVLNSRTAKMISPFSGYTQIIKYPGTWWLAKLKWELLTYNEALAIKSFVTLMMSPTSNNAQYCYLQDYSYHSALSSYSSQYSATLYQGILTFDNDIEAYKGLQILQEGSLFSLINVYNHELKVSTGSCTAPQIGGSFIFSSFLPKDTRITNNTAVTVNITAPTCTMRIADNYVPHYKNRGNYLTDFEIDFVECFV